MIYKTLSGADIDLPHAPALEAFFGRLRAALEDETVTIDAFIALGYGRENPILEVKDGHAMVTPKAFATPWYRVLADMLCRKERQQDAKSFTLTVAEAATRLGFQETAVRNAINRGTLTARRIGNEYRLSPAEVELYRNRTPSKRGPKPREPDITVLARIGSAPGLSFRLKGARVGGPKTGNVRLGTLLPGWSKVLVLASATGKSARLWEVAPAPGATADVTFESFYLRGAFKILRVEEDEQRARDAFADFRDESGESP